MTAIISASWFTRNGSIAVEWTDFPARWTRTFRREPGDMLRMYVTNDRVPRLSGWAGSAYSIEHYETQFSGLADALAHPLKHQYHYAAQDERCMYCREAEAQS